MMSDFAGAARAAGLDIECDRSLREFTTYRVGGLAQYAVTPRSVEEIEILATLCVEHRIDRICALGRGSNVIIADEGVAGVVLLIGPQLSAVTIDGHRVECEAGAQLPVVARQTVKAGLTGFEWAVGVPGSIGGAVVMNAGGHGSDMAAAVTSVRLFDMRGRGLVEQTNADMGFGYRRSSVGTNEIVVSAVLELSVGQAAKGERELSEIVAWRRGHQPGGRNAGSVFANPPGDSAGRMIDALGLKGFRMGTAAVSDKHANFIQADEDGKAADVAALMIHLQRKVMDHYGVMLHPENRLIGFETSVLEALGVTT